MSWRIAMKSNWGPEGLHQAEGLLSSALRIQPASADAKILLGYVYANQKRFAAAEAQFADAAKSNTSNPWLWTNWGQLLLMEGNPIRRSPSSVRGSNDRSRMTVTTALIATRTCIYWSCSVAARTTTTWRRCTNGEFAELGRGACYTSDYAQFMLQVRGDPQDAIDLARRIEYGL
jgi:tetratricopeptide (TPR) repeat protein